MHAQKSLNNKEQNGLAYSVKPLEAFSLQIGSFYSTT
jgi:hypothetical protein